MNPHKEFHLTSPKYRRDIDGLRAVAVMAVVGFHAFPNLLKGGFIGVDIFFVISGFLISSILFDNLEKNSFSFIEFYERRIKRIFPALIVVMLSSLFMGWFALLPSEYEQLGKHVAAGAGFVSNLVLWGESGYFDNAADTKPLLHLWSLGIEEQFYIFWPLLLGAVWRYKHKHNFLTITLLVAAMSFAINLLTIRDNSVASFFSPFARFWELMVGGILAYIAVHRSYRLPLRSDWQSVFGLIFIGVALLSLNKETLFPGWWALLPTIGTFFIISAGPSAWLNRNLLANPVVVWVGLISYPLYLWHWPLLSFARIVDERTPSLEVRVGVIVTSFILAWLTYRWIEQPVRFGGAHKLSALIVGMLMCITGGLGGFAYYHHGLVSNPAMMENAKKAEELNYEKHWDAWQKCRDEHSGCMILDPLKAPDIVVIGDSHAGHLAAGLSSLYEKSAHNVAIRLKPGCFPFYPLESNNKKFFSCEENFIAHALDLAMRDSSVKTIILSGYANLKIKDGRGDPGMFDNPSDDYREQLSESELKEKIDAFRKGLSITLRRLVSSGKEIIFLVDVPELYFDPRECVALGRVKIFDRSLRTPCVVDREKFDKRTVQYRSMVAEAKIIFPMVKFVNAYDYLCDKERCNVMRNGALLYSSRDHLTPSGSRYLIRKIYDDHELPD